MRSSALLPAVLLCCCATVSAAPPADTAKTVDDTTRAQTYKEFRALFDAHQYERALALAQQLVVATEQQYGDQDRALVNPLCNLGTTQYRLRNFDEAARNFGRAVELLEDAGADRRLLTPLQGLGVSDLALKQYEDAGAALKRAVDLSRNMDGLFNTDQLKYLRPLIEAYVALGRNADADQEHQYVVRIAENAYGKDDTHLLPVLDTYARWLEDQGRYTSARSLHQRALELAQKAGGKESILTVTPLEGLARSYRLEFLNGSEPPSESSEAFAGNAAGLRAGEDRLNPDGERLLRQALMAVDKAQPVDRQRRGEALIELGDWYLSAGATPKALETYREAWKELAQVDGAAVLAAPRLIAYRPSAASVERSTLDPDAADSRYVEVGFTVTKDGRTADVAVKGSDAPEALQKAVVMGVKKARYSPRFEDGQAVETKGMTLREGLRVKKAKSKT